MAFDANDFKYQYPKDPDPMWVETILFPIVIPEEHLYAFIYVNVRPAFGVMWNQVIVCGTLTDTRAELLHYNENHFLPAPADFTEISSSLGLKISGAGAPDRFRIDYVADDGTEIHVDWENLMAPFDIHDPSHSPQAGRAFDIHADITADKPHDVGHCDATGRATGVVKTRGRSYPVDSIERMDRSWGARDPMKAGKPNHIVSATFDENLAFHMICPWNPEKPADEAFTLSHGYVLDQGEVFGLTDKLVMTSAALGFAPTDIRMTVTDTRGKQHVLRASPDIGAPWIAAPSALVHLSLMRWTYEGRAGDGYGIVMRTHHIRELNERFGRFHDDPPRVVHV